MKTKSADCRVCNMLDHCMFKGFSQKKLEKIDSLKTSSTFKARKSIFTAGSEPAGLYCIRSGKVKLYQSAGNKHRRLVGLAGPSDLPGYQSFLVSEPYRVTAETLEESVICFFDKDDFFKLLTWYPTAAVNLMNLLVEDLRQAEMRLKDLTDKSIHQRFAEILLSLKSKYGRKTEKGFMLNVLLTRKEMGELIGSTTESIIRMVSEFKKKGFITAEGRRITLIDIPGLLEDVKPGG